jgi:hypothetical protein
MAGNKGPPAVRRYLALHRGIKLAALLGSITRRMSGGKLPMMRTFAGAARVIAMGRDR